MCGKLNTIYRATTITSCWCCSSYRFLRFFPFAFIELHVAELCLVFSVLCFSSTREVGTALSTFMHHLFLFFFWHNQIVFWDYFVFPYLKKKNIQKQNFLFSAHWIWLVSGTVFSWYVRAYVCGSWSVKNLSQSGKRSFQDPARLIFQNDRHTQKQYGGQYKTTGGLPTAVSLKSLVRFSTVWKY